MTTSIDLRSAGSKSQRKIRNFLLQPLIQIRIAAWSALASAVFSLAIALVFYFSLRSLAEAFSNVGHLDDETINRTYNMFEGVRLSALGLLLTQVLVSVVVSIVTTHRLVGPTVAFRQQIRALINGKYGQKVILRNNDAFQEVALDLNELSEQLQKESQKKSGPSAENKSSRAVNE